VIADIESDDDSFLKNAARRGIFAYVKLRDPSCDPVPSAEASDGPRAVYTRPLL
jgi:hypothetical protein